MQRELLRALDAACAAFGGAVAIVDACGSYGYAELSADADAIALALTASGAAMDEPVVVLVSSQARDWGAFLGAWRAGCVVVPVHRGTAPGALDRILGKTAARFIVDGDPGKANLPADIANGATTVCDGRLARLDRPSPAARPMLADGALVIFTSGSTGQPKGVVSTHGAWKKKLDAIDAILRFERDTRVLVPLQITFAFGIWVSLLALTRGGTVLLHDRFEPKRVVAALADALVTHVAMVPTMLRALVAQLDDPAVRSAIARVNGARLLRQLLTGGETLGENLNRALLEIFPGVGLYDIYGLTETTTSDFFLVPEDQPRHFGCIGRPSPGVRYRIANERGEQAASGESGELQILSEFIMRGYLDEPLLTANAFSGEWFRTGDVGQAGEDGIVRLVGRSKELISRGAVKISPIEIEQIFGKHPDVAEVLVSGVPDALMGERIHILLISRAGTSLSEDELRTWSRQWLEKNRVPDVFHFGSTLPLGRTGKADRGRMREIVTGGGPLGG